MDPLLVWIRIDTPGLSPTVPRNSFSSVVPLVVIGNSVDIRPLDVLASIENRLPPGRLISTWPLLVSNE
jgi:hypothetical protein